MAERILVVEDEPDMAMGLRDNLEFEGYEVHTAETGEDGLELAAKTDPQCILLDLMLPGIDGFETLRRLRASQETADIPVVFLSAHANVESIEEGKALGAAGYFTKPFQFDEILAKVKEILGE